MTDAVSLIIYPPSNGKLVKNCPFPEGNNVFFPGLYEVSLTSSSAVLVRFPPV